MTKTLILDTVRSIAFGTAWVLRREVDQRIEADGFLSEQEARDWATEFGWEIRE